MAAVFHVQNVSVLWIAKDTLLISGDISTSLQKTIAEADLGAQLPSH